MKRTLLICLAALAASRESTGENRAGAFLLAGQTIDASFQGHAEMAAPGLFAEKALSPHFSGRVELFPFQVIREGPGRLHRGDASRRTATSSAGGLLVRCSPIRSGPSSPFVDAGIGPFYSYQRTVPADGTHGNYFVQAGLGVSRTLASGGRWEMLLRAIHVSNGHGSDPRNPGYTFAVAGAGWSFTR